METTHYIGNILLGFGLLLAAPECMCWFSTGHVPTWAKHLTWVSVCLLIMSLTLAVFDLSYVVASHYISGPAATRSCQTSKPTSSGVSDHPSTVCSRALPE